MPFSSTSRLPEIRPGTSISRKGGSSGTIGCIVRDAGGVNYILSNAHVLADLRGLDGNGDAPDSPVIQPGVDDLAHAVENEVAITTKAFYNQWGDMAIAKLNGTRPPGLNLWGLKAALTGSRMARPGEVVMKSGRSTRLTYGKVLGISRYTVQVDRLQVTMEGMMIVPRDEGTVISGPGDSGSVWFSPSTREAVGLHVAGGARTPRHPGYAIACHFPTVLRELQVSLVVEP